jgi:hypothetical protein
MLCINYIGALKMKHAFSRHWRIIKTNRKTTLVGLAVLAGTGVKWSLGAASPTDIPTIASSMVEVLVGFGLLLAKDYDVLGVPSDKQLTKDDNSVI